MQSFNSIQRKIVRVPSVKADTFRIFTVGFSIDPGNLRIRLSLYSCDLLKASEVIFASSLSHLAKGMAARSPSPSDLYCAAMRLRSEIMRADAGRD